MKSIISIFFATMLLGALVVPAHSVHGQEQTLSGTSYVLSIDERGPGSADMLAGNYTDAAQAAARSFESGDNLSAQHTLCAANIALANFVAAEAACDRAIDLAKRTISTTANPYGQRNREGLAKAYSNRAVLHALQGDEMKARSYLRQAQRADRINATVDHNLRIADGSERAARR